MDDCYNVDDDIPVFDVDYSAGKLIIDVCKESSKISDLHVCSECVETVEEHIEELGYKLVMDTMDVIHAKKIGEENG
jgi:hypothetical protein